MNDMIVKGHPIQLVETHGEPTVRDVDLGARLGFKRPDNIRRVIERNRPEIESYGGLRQVDANPGPKGGRPTIEYHLTEEQALCVCQLSRAPNAPAVRRMLIEVFTAYRRGLIVPDLDRAAVGGIVKGVIRRALDEALHEMLPAMVRAELAAGDRAVTTDFKPARFVLDQMKMKPSERRGLSTPVCKQLQRYSARNGQFAAPRECPVTGRYMFHVDLIRDWLASGGGALFVAECVARKRSRTTNAPDLFVITDGGKRQKKPTGKGEPLRSA